MTRTSHGTKTPLGHTAQPTFEHRPGCSGLQVDRFGPGPTGTTVLRCPYCGAERVEQAAPLTIDIDGASITVGDERFCELWEQQPHHLYDALTPEQRRDPRLNPLHLNAELPTGMLRMHHSEEMYR